MNHNMHEMLGVSQELWEEFLAEASLYFEPRMVQYVQGCLPMNDMLHGTVTIMEEDLDHLQFMCKHYFGDKHELAYAFTRCSWAYHIRIMAFLFTMEDRILLPTTQTLPKN